MAAYEPHDPEQEEEFQGFFDEPWSQDLLAYFQGLIDDEEEDIRRVEQEDEMAASTLIGSLPPFSPKEETFQDFVIRFDDFCELNERVLAPNGAAAEAIQKSKKLLFLTNLPVEVRSTLARLCQPTIPKDKTLQELKQLLTKHYNPPGLALTAVRKFQRVVQTPTETISDFILKLRTASKDCNFGNDLDRSLFNQFCLGLRSEKAVDSITFKGEYNPDSHNFDHACQIAQQQETLEAQRQERKLDREAAAAINKIGRGQFKKQLQQQEDHCRGRGRGSFRGNFQTRGQGQRGNSHPRGQYQENSHPRGQYQERSAQEQHNNARGRGGPSRGYNTSRGNGRHYHNHPSQTCWRCGRFGCNPNHCWAKNAECYTCGQLGHAKYYHNRRIGVHTVNNETSNGERSNESNQEGNQNQMPEYNDDMVFIRKIVQVSQLQECYTVSSGVQEAEDLTRSYEEALQKNLPEVQAEEHEVNQGKFKVIHGEIDTVQEELEVINEEQEEQEETEEKGLVHFVKINSVTKHPEVMIGVTINEKKVPMEIDTGSGVTLMHWEQFQRLFQRMSLKKSNLQLITISSPITVEGAAIVKVIDSEGVEHQMDLVVCKTSFLFHPLVGRNWLDVLYPKWRKFFKEQAGALLIANVQTVRPEVQRLMDKYPEVFSEDRSQAIQGFQARIVIKENPSFVCHTEYELPYSVKQVVSDQLRMEVQEGRLIPVDKAEAGVASPLWPIPRSNGTYRLCADYKRTLNPNLVIDYYPLPKAEDVYNSMTGCNVFSVIDLSEAYLQMEVAEEFRKYLVISTHLGYFKPTRLMFGIASAPAIFQQFMDNLTKDLCHVKCYLDDVIVGAKDQKEMMSVLEILFGRFAKVNIRVKLEKCDFFQLMVEYLGHILSGRGIQVSPKRVRPILEAREPSDVSELRAFLGMVNYYRRFIPNSSELLAPLNDLLQKESALLWTDVCSKVVQEVKDILASNRILMLYDPSKPLVLVCDASPRGAGVVLAHRLNGVEFPISFAATTFNQTQQKYAQLDREALAIVFGLTKFHKYLAGRKFFLVTDNLPLKWLLSPDKPLPIMSAARIQRWAMIVRAYDFVPEYRPTAEMGPADMLSRLGTLEEVVETVCSVYPLHCSIPVSFEVMAEATSSCEVLKRVMEMTLNGWPQKMSADDVCYPYFKLRLSISVEQGCLLFGEKVIVPKSLQGQVLDLLHAGHPGAVRMKMLARMHVYWPNIEEAIGQYVKNCDACSQINFKPVSVETAKWPATNVPWTRLHLDFFYFQTVTLLILVDSYTKWIEVWPVNATSAKCVIGCLRKVFATFGLPLQIVTDNGPPFDSFEFLEFCTANSIIASKSPPYHPQSNGQGENAVKTMKHQLKKVVMKVGPGESDTLEFKVVNIVHYYRNIPCTVTKQTPAQMMLKFEPRTHVSLLSPKPSMVKTYVPRTPVFVPGEKVKVRKKAGEKAIVGEILKQIGTGVYLINLNNVPTLCHVNQMSTSVPNEDAVVLKPLSSQDFNMLLMNNQGIQEMPPEVQEAPSPSNPPSSARGPRVSPRATKGVPPSRLDL